MISHHAGEKRCLATGCTAGIENGFPGSRREQATGEGGAGILDVDQPIFDPLRVRGAFETEKVGVVGADEGEGGVSGSVLSGEGSLLDRTRDPVALFFGREAIDPGKIVRGSVVPFQECLGVLIAKLLDPAIDEIARMRIPILQRPGLDLFLQLGLLSQGIPENRVDEASLVLAGQVDRLVDGCVLGDAGAEQLEETDPEKVTSRRFHRATTKFVNEPVEKEEISDGSVEDLLGEGSIGTGKAKTGSLGRQDFIGVSRCLFPLRERFEGAAASGHGFGRNRGVPRLQEDTGQTGSTTSSLTQPRRFPGIST